jgi:hypothetical protein
MKFPSIANNTSILQQRFSLMTLNLTVLQNLLLEMQGKKGRPVGKRMKQKTRETEARRRYNLVPGSLRVERQEHQNNDLLSQAQAQTDLASSTTHKPDSRQM